MKFFYEKDLHAVNREIVGFRGISKPLYIGKSRL